MEFHFNRRQPPDEEARMRREDGRRWVEREMHVTGCSESEAWARWRDGKPDYVDHDEVF